MSTFEEAGARAPRSHSGVRAVLQSQFLHSAIHSYPTQGEISSVGMTQSLAVFGGEPVRRRPFPAWPVFGREEERALLRVLHSGQWGKLDGDETTRFEKRFADYVGAKHAIAV